MRPITGIMFFAAFLIVVASDRSAHALSSDESTCLKEISDTDEIMGVIESCSRLIDLSKSSSSPIRYLESRGRARKLNGECDLAITDFENAMQKIPNRTSANDMYFNLTLVLANTWLECKGDADRAIISYGAVIKLRPREEAGYFMRGNAWQEKRDYDKAMADQNTALSVATKPYRKALIFNSRALVWRDKGDYDRAISDFNNAVRLAPAVTSYLTNRGESWRLKGDLDRAIADQSLAVALDAKLGEKSHLVYELRGDTYRYKGDFARAIADYEQALRFTPDSIPAFTGLGLTYERMGEIAKARVQFEKASASLSAQRFYDISKSSLETARARIAAFDSGEPQPAIQPAPPKTVNPSSIPTPSIQPRRPASERTKTIPDRGRRVALVIGNSAYKNVSQLTNPQNDANAIAKSLRDIGFDNVTVANDATREQMINALRNFANEAERSEWAMVYYAGHGMEVGGVNYLIPIDAKIAVDRDIQFDAVPLTQVLNAADAAKKIKLVVLDACRDNPFKPRQTAAPEVVAASMSTAGAPIATRSSNGHGLAEVKVTGATLVVYAAKDGQLALDGEGGNSPFAVAVVQRLATPGVEINKLFRLVRDDVMEATAGRQEPYTYGSLPGKEDFFFVAK